MNTVKLVILDRDGTLNPLGDDFITSPEEWSAQPGALEAVARLNHAGWRVVVATNQSGLARGYYDDATLQAMHQRLRQLVAEQGGELGIVVHCPHGPDHGCECRKPRPGMLLQIAEHYRTSLKGVWFVGDSSADLQAALAVDCQPVLVKTGKGQRTLSRPLPANTLVFDDLAAVAAQLLA